ncbi:hypothetical protein GMMP15_1530024 [Candidatus Magnetomoraceae bacterium gMMP-15]
MSNKPPQLSIPEVSWRNLDKYIHAWQQLNEKLYEKFNKKIITILTTDMCNYGPYDTIRDRVMLQQHNNIIFSSIAQHKGNIIRSSGNTVLNSFSDTVEAVRAAMDIQAKLNLYNLQARRMGKSLINIKIGINRGQIMLDGEDIYGDAGKLAAVIQSQASEDEIFIDKSVYDQIQHIDDINCVSQNKIKIRGRRGTIALYKVLWPKMIEQESQILEPDEKEVVAFHNNKESEDENKDISLSFLPTWVFLVIAQIILLFLYIILR